MGIRKKKEFMFVPENLQSAAGGVSRSTTNKIGTLAAVADW